MGNRSTRRAPVDRHGQASPEPAITALCAAGRCTRCKGEVLSLLHPVGTRCQHPCHAQQLPATWAEQVATFPPCEGVA